MTLMSAALAHVAIAAMAMASASFKNLMASSRKQLLACSNGINRSTVQCHGLRRG
jgi:hypothetical protein